MLAPPKPECFSSRRQNLNRACSVPWRFWRLRRIVRGIFYYGELSSRVLRAHIPNLAVYRTLRTPRPIIPAECPENSAVGVGISPVQSIFIIQLDHDRRRFLRRPRPLQNFLRPQHAEVIVHPPFADKLHLRRIPQGIVRGSGGKLIERINDLPFIPRVLS